MQALYTMIQINIKPCGMSVPVTVQTARKRYMSTPFEGRGVTCFRLLPGRITKMIDRKKQPLVK